MTPKGESLAEPMQPTARARRAAFAWCAVLSLGILAHRRAVSSAVEHCFHTAGVTGSIPVPPTTQRRSVLSLLLDRQSETSVPAH
jgi:hypothetical protein